MAFYDDMQSLATSMLLEFGSSITWTVTSGATFDPVLGQDSGGTTSNKSGYGVVTDFDKALVDGQNIKATDKQLLLQSGDVPAVNDRLTIYSNQYSVVRVNEKNYGGTVIYYDIQLRS